MSQTLEPKAIYDRMGHMKAMLKREGREVSDETAMLMVLYKEGLEAIWKISTKLDKMTERLPVPQTGLVPQRPGG